MNVPLYCMFVDKGITGCGALKSRVEVAGSILELGLSPGNGVVRARFHIFSLAVAKLEHLEVQNEDRKYEQSSELEICQS